MFHVIRRTLVAGLLCLAAVPGEGLRPLAFAQSDDRSAVRTLVEKFFAAYQKEDLSGITALWSASAPEPGGGRRELERALAEAERIEVRRVDFKETTVEGERARVEVAVELRQVNLKDGKGSEWSGLVNRVLHLAREGGRWKIAKYLSGELELAERLGAAATEAERERLLAEKDYLVTVELVGALRRLAWNLTDESKYKEALAVCDVALKIAGRVNDKTGYYRTLNNIGVIYRHQGDYARALEYHQRTLKLSEEAGNRDDVARALNNIGIVHDIRGDYAQALDFYQRSLKIKEELGNKATIATTLNNIGAVYEMRGDYALALDHFRRSLKINEELGEKREIFNNLINIGVIYFRLDDYAQAMDYYRRALQVSEERGDKAGVAAVLNNTGHVRYEQGDYAGALDDHLKSLKLSEELGHKTEVSEALHSLGRVYDVQGDFARAIDSYQRSLKIAEESGNEPASGGALNNIGLVYAQQGDFERALDYYRRSLAIKEKIGHKQGVSITLTNIGFTHQARGDYAAALDHFRRSLKLDEELGSKSGMSRAYINIGLVKYEQGDYAAALDHFRKGLEISEGLGNKGLTAAALLHTGEAYLRLGEHARAGEFAGRASALASRSGMAEIFGEARTLEGKAYLALNRHDLAREAFAAAIAAVEERRGLVAGGEQDAQRFFENRLKPYYAMIELLVRQNDLPAALTYAERAKGRVLLDVLTSGRVSVTKAMTPEERERDRTLNAEIVSLNVQIQRQKLREPPDAKLLTELSARLEGARLRFESFRAGLYAAHPDLKIKRGETEALTPADASRLLKGGETALLEYVVGGDKSYLFVVTREAGANRPGAPGVKIKVFPVNIRDTELAQMVGDFRRRVAGRDLTVKNQAQRLYDLLVRPAEKELVGVKELAIVPDGSLWNLPFQALHGRQQGYLLERYAVSYAPSLSVLREMTKKEAARRSPESPAGRNAFQAPPPPELLAVGNPSLSGEQKGKVASIYREEKLGPLPEAEEEVNTLARLYGRGRARVLVKEQAREQTIKEEAGRFRILHFATHALLDDRNPMYSRIVLSQSAGAGPEDGLLEAREILELDLGADLVVLAACQTAGGRVGAGEGIIGTSWALFVAGTSSTVATQWKVESARASDLMVEFHRNLLRRAGGRRAMSKAQALRLAALKQLHGPYNHPAYWAAFIIIGDPR